MLKDKIETLIKNNINAEFIDIKDLRSRHINHKTYSGGAHLKLLVVSDDFKNISLVNRHKMIYEIIGDLIKKEIHALSIETKTINEYK